LVRVSAHSFLVQRWQMPSQACRHEGCHRCITRRGGYAFRWIAKDWARVSHIDWFDTGLETLDGSGAGPKISSVPRMLGVAVWRENTIRSSDSIRFSLQLTSSVPQALLPQPLQLGDESAVDVAGLRAAELCELLSNNITGDGRAQRRR
jgi:hypothetical protein